MSVNLLLRTGRLSAWTADPGPPPDPPSIIYGLWTPTWLANMQQYQIDGHPWWTLLASNASKTGTGTQRYGDTGMWACIYYKVTGDTAYAAKAATCWLGQFGDGATGNTTRENFIEGVILYDALLPTLTGPQQTTWLNRLNLWAANAISTYRGIDGDQTIGTVLGAQLLDYVAGTTWSASMATMIAKVQWYIDHFAGGELDESFEYNQGTATFLMMGLAALPPGTYSGTDTFLAAHAAYLPFSVTPDLAQYQQWGDTQNVRDFTGRLYKTMTNWMVAQGLTGDAGLMAHINEIVTAYGYTGFGSAEPWARGFLFYDPYATPAASSPRGQHYASGRGHVYMRTDDMSALLVASKRTYEDHEWWWTFNVNIYRNGEWVITSPLAYGNWPAYRAEGSNGISLSGLASMETRGVTQRDTGADWMALTGQTSGTVYDTGSYYDPPPEYVHACERKALLIENVGGYTVVVTRDDTDMEDPQTLAKFARYRNSGLWLHQTWITAASGKVWTNWRALNTPTIVGDQMTWTTTGGQLVTVNLHSAGTITNRTVAETTLGTAIATGEMKTSVQFTSTDQVLWSVVFIGTGTPPSYTLNTGTDVFVIDGRTFTFTGAGVVES